MIPTVPSSSSICFGVFEADLDSGELRKKGVRVKIQDLPFKALRLLLTRPNEVLSREEFRSALWPENVFVDFDRGITSAINRLREALGDSAENPVFVETVGRRGYRWIAPTRVNRESAAVREVKALAVEPAIIVPSPATSGRRWPAAVALGFALVAITVYGARAHWQIGHRSEVRSSSSSSQTPSHRPANHEAEELYLQGRFYWNKRTPESLNRALDSFMQAIVHDPNYSDAYVGLADCYNLLREYTAMPASEAYPRALAAAKKAVELNDSSSQAHASLAFVSFNWMWDAKTADSEFRRAIELDPNNATAHHWYATYLYAMRRSSDSLTQIERAQALDPNSASILADKGVLLWGAGRRQEALELLRRLAEVDPSAVSPHRYLGAFYLETGDYRGYLLESKKEATLAHNPLLSSVTDAAQRGFAAQGVRGMFEARLDVQKKFYAQGKISPYLVAQTYARLGKVQDALNYLQISYDQHADETINMGVDSAFDTLQSQPAFRELLGKIGIPAASTGTY